MAEHRNRSVPSSSYGKRSARNRRTKRRTGTRQTLLTARSADKQALYQMAVQDPAAEIKFISRVFKQLRGRGAMALREDFCGTALLCTEWVRSSSRSARLATGVDLDPSVLTWGRQHNIVPLGARAERVQLLQQDVREHWPTQHDVIAAFNFSYWVFVTRDEMRHYFETVLRSLNADGLLFLDAYGGWEAQQPMLESRSIGRGVTYVWDQDRVDPITHRIVNHIHFRFRDGSQLKKAFTYEWRFWSLPELSELLQEAGFSDVTIYWDDTDDEEDARYRPQRRAANQPGWLAYLVAAR